MSVLGRIWKWFKALAGDAGATIRGMDPRRFLSGAAPGLWASNHLEETNQCKGWQFVAVRTLSKMAAQAEVSVHQVEAAEKRERRLQRSLQRAKAAGKLSRANAIEARLQRMVASKQEAAPQGQRPDRHPVEASHPLLRLMERCNPEWSGATLRFAIAQQLCLTGTALVWIVRNGLGVPVELYVIPTGLATPRFPTPAFPKGSWWLAPVSAWGLTANSVWAPGALGMAILTGTEIDGCDVKAIRWPHPLYLSDGLSPLAAGAMWVDLASEIDRSCWYAMQNAERPGLVFSQDPAVDPSPEERAAFREDLRAEAAGTPNTGKHLLMPKGISAANLSPSQAEMDYANSRPQVRDMNLALHGVTPISAGIAEAGSFAAYWASLKQTTELSAQPMLDLIAEELSEALGSEFGAGRYEIGMKAKAIDDPQVLEQRFRTDIQAGNTLTVDEYRAMRGLKPLGGAAGKAFVGAKQTAPVDPDGKPTDDEQGDPSRDSTGLREPARDAVPGRQDRDGKLMPSLNGRGALNGVHEGHN